MPNSYYRRAFLLAALSALEPTALSPARADSDSLWDILTRADRAPSKRTRLVNARVSSEIGALEAGPAPRQPLGPVPGFSLPSKRRGAALTSADSLFSKKPQARGMFGSVGEYFERLKAATGTKIKVTGHQTFSFRMDNVSGSQATYQDDHYYGQGSNGFYSDTDMTIDATLFKYFHYQTRVSNSLFQNPNDNRVKLDYNNRNIRFEWGDINAGFQGNSLIDFSRYLHGVQVQNQWTKQFRTVALYSQTKAETRTITIPGNDSAGPYYVYAGQIVEGSDHIRVDNRDMIKGRDYTLDTYTGELRFLNGNIILHSSTIAVSFETQGYNQSQGNIYGIRSEYNPHGATKFGLTYVTQQARGSNGTQPRTQSFFGYETPGAAYILDSPFDITRPIVVKVAGVPLAQGVDYIVDNTLKNQIRIVQAVPSTMIVEVTYVPLDINPTPGNRSVLGLDGTLSLGKLGTLTAEAAMSGLSVTNSNYSGHAIQLRADTFPFRNFHANLAVRDISPTFSSIQSPGFNRNERAIDFNGDYAPFKNLKLTMSWEKAKRPSYGETTTSLFTPSIIGMDTYNQYTLGANYTFARNGTISLTRSSLGTDYITGGNASNVSDTLSIGYGIRSVTFDIGLSHNKSHSVALYSSSATTPATLAFYDTSSLSKRIGIHWQASHWLTLSGNLSDNDIKNQTIGSGSRTNARDTQISANMNLLRNLHLNYAYDLSDTGNGTTGLLTPVTTPTGSTGTTGTTGTGGSSGSTGTTPVNAPARSIILPGTRDIVAGGTQSSSFASSSFSNGFTSQFGSGGVNNNLGSFGNYSGIYGSSYNNNYGLASFGGRSAAHRVSLDWQPSSATQFSLQLDTSSSFGDYQYNSSRNNMGFTFGWQPSDRLTLNANYSIQRVAYNGGYGSTGSNMIYFALQGHPFGRKLGVQVGWQMLRTTSNVNFNATTTPGTTVTTPTVTDTNSDLNSLNLRLDYPVFRGQTLFFEMLTSQTSGYLGTTENDMRIGIDFPLTRALKFSLGWQIISRLNKDPQYKDLDYKASSLLAELGLRF